MMKHTRKIKMVGMMIPSENMALHAMLSSLPYNKSPDVNPNTMPLEQDTTEGCFTKLNQKRTGKIEIYLC